MGNTKFDHTKVRTAQLPTANKYSQGIEVHLDPQTKQQVLKVKNANGGYTQLDHVDKDTLTLPFPKAGARELGETKKFFVEVAVASFKAPTQAIKKGLPLAINLGMAGLGGYGTWCLAKTIVMAIAPHAAHSVLLGVSIAAVGLFAVVVGAYWLHKLGTKPGTGKLNAMLQDDKNYQHAVQLNEAMAKAPSMPAALASEKSNRYYASFEPSQEKYVAKKAVRSSSMRKAPSASPIEETYIPEASPAMQGMHADDNGWNQQ